MGAGAAARGFEWERTDTPCRRCGPLGRSDGPWADPRALRPESPPPPTQGSLTPSGTGPAGGDSFLLGEAEPSTSVLEVPLDLPLDLRPRGRVAVWESPCTHGHRGNAARPRPLPEPVRRAPRGSSAFGRQKGPLWAPPRTWGSGPRAKPGADTAAEQTRLSPRAASPRDTRPHRGLGTRAALYSAPRPHETLRRGAPGPDAGAASPGSPGPSAGGVPWPSVFRDCSKCYHSSRNHATVTGPRLTAKGSRELQTRRDDRRTERHRPPQATAGRGRARRRGGTGHAAPSRPGPPHRSRPRTRGLSPPPARPQRCRRHRRREGADGRGSEKDSKR